VLRAHHAARARGGGGEQARRGAEKEGKVAVALGQCSFAARRDQAALGGWQQKEPNIGNPSGIVD